MRDVLEAIGLLLAMAIGALCFALALILAILIDILIAAAPIILVLIAAKFLFF